MDNKVHVSGIFLSAFVMNMNNFYVNFHFLLRHTLMDKVSDLSKLLS